MMKLIVTGATGTAGSEALRQALLHPSIEKVTVLTRRPLPDYIVAALPPPNPNPKLEVVLHNDFSSYSDDLLNGVLRDHDAALWDLGKSSVGMSEQEYTVLTHDYTLEAAKAFSKIPRSSSDNSTFRFCYCSGEGADMNEKAYAMFGRVKGRTEKHLAELADQTSQLSVFNFRPAGIKATLRDPAAAGLKTAGRDVLLAVFKPLGMVIDSSDLARGMLVAAVEGKTGKLAGWEGKGESKQGNKGVFSNGEIKQLAKRFPKTESEAQIRSEL